MVELRERFVVDVHHVAGVVFAGRDAGAQFRIEPQMVERIFGGEKWRRKIEVSRSHEEMHVGILDDGAAQRRTDVGKARCRRTPFPAVNATAEHVIGQVGFVAELGADVVVKSAGEGRPDGRFARVIVRALRNPGNVDAFEAAVEPADRTLLVAQQFLPEFPALSGWGKLRHHARGGPIRIPCQSGRRARRHRSGLHGSQF